MESNLDSKTYWVNIVIKADFFEYLEPNLLKEVSLISKIAREKLKPHLFRNLELSSNIFEFKIKDNDFIEYIKRFVYPDTCNGTDVDIESYLKCLGDGKNINSFDFLLKDIKKFAKNLKVEHAKKVEYYLFPIINVFNNLTSLKLRSCCVPLTAFNKLGESLLNLKSLEMNYINLYVLPSFNINSDQVILPSSLICLDIEICAVVSSSLISNPFGLLSGQNTHDTYTSFNIPIVSLPYLKKLTYFNFDDNYAELYSFLAINSSLEYLRIKLLSLDLIEQLKSLKCLEFETITQLDTKSQTCALNSILKLTVFIFFSDYYEDIKNLCLFCPNLQEISFYMGHGEHQKSIDDFLIPLVPKLPSLKTLKLAFGAPKDNKLNFTKLSNIESLIVDTEASSILNLSFDTCAKLKKIDLISYIGKVNTQEFRDKFNTYKDWTFRFSSGKIKGYKINK